jgi:hypothetical protein
MDANALSIAAGEGARSISIESKLCANGSSGGIMAALSPFIANGP